jgi:hypothetical protein
MTIMILGDTDQRKIVEIDRHKALSGVVEFGRRSKAVSDLSLRSRFRKPLLQR